jgi:hypothetical protein
VDRRSERQKKRGIMTPRAGWPDCVQTGANGETITARMACDRRND